LAHEHQARLSLLHVLQRPRPGAVSPQTTSDLLFRRLQELVPQDTELWRHPEYFIQSGPPAERILQFSGHTWDVSILDIITSLSHGACICIPSDFDRMNNLPRFVNESRVDFMSLTPSVAQTLSPSELPNIKSLAVLGESWGQGIMDVWAGKVKIFNVYGPTEVSVLCTVTEVDPDNYRKHNLGFAVGACLWVADPNDHHALLPIGAVGELLLEGSILGKAT